MTDDEPRSRGSHWFHGARELIRISPVATLAGVAAVRAASVP